MTESQFVEQNKEKWQELESLLQQKNRDADRLQSLFIKVSSDLSYARTFYPNRSVRLYLNNLTIQVFDLLQDHQTTNTWEALKSFFSETLPFEIYNSRKALMTSLVIFIMALLIGIVSSANNQEFANVILGDNYVELTLQNIENGDPLAIYKHNDQVDMFMGITSNNIRVSFLAFIFGLLGSLGTVILLMYNGIMVGAFQYFFYSKGLLYTSFLTIWIHGTIEISAIIIAGGAGIILGNGVLFPGTYDRSTSLIIHAKRAFRILLGTVPLFIIAGLLESFVTRLTDLPEIVKWGIILTSALLILIMWVIFPIYRQRFAPTDTTHLEILPTHKHMLIFDKYKVRTLGQTITVSLAQFRMSFGYVFKNAALPILIIAALIYWITIRQMDVLTFMGEDSLSLFHGSTGGLYLFLFYWLAMSYTWCIVSSWMHDQPSSELNWALILKKLPIVGIISLLLTGVLYTLPPWAAILIILAISPQFIAYTIDATTLSSRPSLEDYKSTYIMGLKSYVPFLISMLTGAFFYLIGIMLFNSGITEYLIDFIQWHPLFENYYSYSLFIYQLLYLSLYILLAPLIYFLIINQYYTEESKLNGTDLAHALSTFGQSKKALDK